MLPLQDLDDVDDDDDISEATPESFNHRVGGPSRNGGGGGGHGFGDAMDQAGQRCVH